MRVNLYLLCGIPGSGKSTWSKQFVTQHEKSIRISRDEIRFSLLKPGEPYQAHQKEEFFKFCEKIQEAIDSEEYNYVIADATHMTEKSRNRVLDRLNLENVDVTVVNFMVSYSLCVERNSKRTGLELVPDYVMEDAFRVFHPVYSDEKYKYYEIINIV